MDRLLKRIADLTLGVVAFLGLLNYLPINIEGKDILVITSIILFVIFIVLIINHVSQLEEQIKNVREKFIREKELSKMKRDISIIKMKIFRK